VVGLARLIERDETGTLARLKALRQELIEPILAGHGGRIVKLMGDGWRPSRKGWSATIPPYGRHRPSTGAPAQ